jgi:hypothetical protein
MESEEDLQTSSTREKLFNQTNANIVTPCNKCEVEKYGSIYEAGKKMDKHRLQWYIDKARTHMK